MVGIPIIDDLLPGGGGGAAASSEVKLDVTSTSTSTSTIDMGLDDINTDTTLHFPDVIETKGTNVVEVKPLDVTVGATVGTDTHLNVEPLRTDSGISVDVKPLVLDLCLTANVGNVPSVCIRQPYNHHIGFTLYGMEVWGFSFSGEQTTVVEELNRQPQVQWGGATTAWPPAPAAPAVHQPPTRDASGLRVRLGS